MPSYCDNALLASAENLPHSSVYVSLILLDTTLTVRADKVFISVLMSLVPLFALLTTGKTAGKSCVIQRLLYNS